METIRNYLEAMFANMPNTPAAQKAKQELWQMMEDKYSELIAEGKSENEAVGTVISEFGNLEELSADLGLKEEFQKVQKYAASQQRRHVTLEETKAFLADTSRHAFCIASGVFLCIASSVAPILSDGLHTREMYGVTGLMAMIAVAVFLFCYSSILHSKWNFLKDSLCSIDYQTAHFLQEQLAHKRPQTAIYKTLGIILCVVCWLPSVFFDNFSSVILNKIVSPVSLLLLIAIGVFLIIYSSMIESGYKTLLELNDKDTMSGSYVPEQTKDLYINDTITLIMSLYWPTVTCIYLIWSFLSFDWAITWIIWPLAGIIHGVIKKNLTKNW